MVVLRKEPLSVHGPDRQGDCEVYLLEDPELELLSVLALHKDRLPGLPALGGTRWLEPEGHEEFASLRARAVREAVRLAEAMQWKLSLLRRAAGESDRHLCFTGGKGVIAGRKGAALGAEELRRLRLHARLVVEADQNYLASKDYKVATPELEVIEAEARRLDPDGRHTIGLGCRRDTGEATAWGVLSGIESSVAEIGLADSLRGLSVLVIGVGKVGLPLVRLLTDRGADVYVFDPQLIPVMGAAEDWFGRLAKDKAAIRPNDLRLLSALIHEGRVLDPTNEEAALSDPRFSVVSPNGGLTNWMLGKLPSGASRFELLSRAGLNGELRLIVGAGNCQLPLSPDPVSASLRREALSTLAEAGVYWIPDPLVSPGGVIAVSHERLSSWQAKAVNTDARGIVRAGIGELFALARNSERSGPEAVFGAFQELRGGAGES